MCLGVWEVLAVRVEDRDLPVPSLRVPGNRWCLGPGGSPPGRSPGFLVERPRAVKSPLVPPRDRVGPVPSPSGDPTTPREWVETSGTSERPRGLVVGGSWSRGKGVLVTPRRGPREGGGTEKDYWGYCPTCTKVALGSVTGPFTRDAEVVLRGPLDGFPTSDPVSFPPTPSVGTSSTEYYNRF